MHGAGSGSTHGQRERVNTDGADRPRTDHSTLDIDHKTGQLVKAGSRVGTIHARSRAETEREPLEGAIRAP